MENWGLVTYREVDLLIDPITASSNQKQRVAVVVAHELAHQYVITMAYYFFSVLSGLSLMLYSCHNAVVNAADGLVIS